MKLTGADSNSRKLYWSEQYPGYWRYRTKEARHRAGAFASDEDRPPSSDDWNAILAPVPFLAGNILDVGCGWGRNFPVFLERGLYVHGLDISAAMVNQAEKRWQFNSLVGKIREGAAEELPYEDGYFSNLACIATFDATHQDQAMNEFLRVTKPGGTIVVSGKNWDYDPDDRLAYEAELGARKKGHPNFFTFTENLLSDLRSNGHLPIDAMFFKRRGDLGKRFFEKTAPEHFYEFVLVIRRGYGQATVRKHFSMFSRTSEKESRSGGHNGAV